LIEIEYDREVAWDELQEKTLLGLAVQFPDRCGGALLTVAPDDWYHPAHKELAATIAKMLNTGQSVDPVTISSQLQAQGLTRFWDPVKIFTLMEMAWRPESASQIAARLRELSGRRKLADACQRTTQRLQSLSETDGSAEVRTATQLLREACDAAEDTAADRETPLPRGMGDFLAAETAARQWLVPGLLERMDRTVITGAEGGGKALAIDTPIPTPKGWTTMGEITVGTEVFSNDGTPARVIAVTEVMEDRPCYRITFSDGAQIVADEQHLWLTESIRARENYRRSGRKSAQVVTTGDIASSVQARGGFALNHSVEVAQPLQYPAQEHPIDAYALGVWLGDGTSRCATITCHPDDAEIIEHIRAVGEDVKQREPMLWAITDGYKSGSKSATFQGRLRTLNLLQNKHIPDRYMHASVDQRLSLLQGLMDSDGTVSQGLSGQGRGAGHAKCEFSVVDKRLAEDFLELVLSLGIKAVMRTGVATLNGRTIGPRYRISFQSDLPVFRLARKLERLGPSRTRRSKLRYIESVERIDSVPVRCIQVDREDGMFVAGRECIPTHNSVLCSQIAACLAGGVHPFGGHVMGSGDKSVRVLVIDCENSDDQSRRRYRWVIDRVKAVREQNDYASIDWNDQMRIDTKPAGIDLLSGRDISWLENAIQSLAPDLLVLGPLYKLHHRDPSEETSAREVAHVIDGLRERHGFALLTEAHAGNSNDMQGNRVMRPIGSSLWRRWPEFGFGIRRASDDPGKARAEVVDVVSWRGAREERAWPTKLSHGHTLPWIPDAEYYDSMNSYE
jgi:hypothetical protein